MGHYGIHLESCNRCNIIRCKTTYHTTKLVGNDFIIFTTTVQSKIALCSIENTGGYGIFLWSTSTDNIITDNYFWSHESACIHLGNECDKNIVSDNRINEDSAGADGIELADADRNIMANNIIELANRGIDIDANSSNNLIIGNMIMDSIFVNMRDNGTDNTKVNNIEL